MDGVDFISFNGFEIDQDEAKNNYQYWVDEYQIPKDFAKDNPDIFENVKKTFGAHTFASRVYTSSGNFYPLFKIFDYDEDLEKFSSNATGLMCRSLTGSKGPHMETATELGLDKFVFSYLGMHLPHHRKEDHPPICPFGVFINIGDFPQVHGSPCDRDYKKNDYVDKDLLSRYFLTPADLQKLITNRILKDPFFEKKFFKYFGSPEYWSEQDYRKEHWKKKGEICYFETVSPGAIKAILWPMWESVAVGEHFLTDSFQELTADFKATFDIDLIIYRPYRDIINETNWKKIEQRDWEIAMIEASYLAQKYYLDQGVFPDSIKFAKAYFKEKTK